MGKIFKMSMIKVEVLILINEQFKKNKKNNIWYYLNHIVLKLYF